MTRQTEGYRMETIVVHRGEPRPGPEGSVVFPIYQGTVYDSEPTTTYHDQKYLRLSSTPSQRHLHDRLAALEGAAAAVATASGMAAATSILLTFLKNGDHLVAADCLYGGLHNFLTAHAKDLGLTVTFASPHDPDAWRRALRPETRLMLFETIANPLMRVPRLTDLVAFAREHRLLTAIDNTFASPVNFRPLSIGFDLVFHSATKYLNGHNDLVAGCVVGAKELVEKVRVTLSHYGGILDPHAGFLLARGLKTLAVRVRAQNANALALARYLSSHPKVKGVSYPGLESHPDHALAREHFSGFGGMLSFRLAGGMQAADRLLAGLNLPHVAPSLGGVESLITRPAATSHASMSPRDRERAGVEEDLLRVSCGIEHADDLVEDFAQALDRS